MYRTTPHSTTGVSLAELIFGRKLLTNLPGVDENKEGDLEVRDSNRVAKEKGKVYNDQKLKAKRSKIKEGDQVLLKHNALSKMALPFEPHPYRVVPKAGSGVTVKSLSGVQYHRNSSHLKVFDGSKLLRESQEEKGETQVSHGEFLVDPLVENLMNLHVRRKLIQPGIVSAAGEMSTPLPTRLRRIPARFKDFELYQGVTQKIVAITSDSLSCLVLLTSQLLLQKGERICPYVVYASLYFEHVRDSCAIC